jgi:N-acetylglucosaminyl-diphospho-decaprenol L-rhamnosyltransferase
VITLSVVSHGQGRLIDRLFDDLARLRPAALTRIVVTRNVAEDWQVPSRIAHCPVLVIDNPKPRGFGANHNAAFAHCATPYFAVVNPDIRLAEDPFPPMLELLADLRLALVTPQILASDGRREDFERALITPWRLVQRRLLNAARASTPAIDWLAGMFMVLRSDAFRAVGGFDERFFMYCEDADLCARLRLRDARFAVCDQSSVVHDAQRASHRSWRHLRWHLISLLKFWLSSAFWRYRALLARERAAGALCEGG